MRSGAEVSLRRDSLVSGYEFAGATHAKAEAYAETVLLFEEALGLTFNAGQQALVRNAVDKLAALAVPPLIVEPAAPPSTSPDPNL